jgi:hypothetical protein
MGVLEPILPLVSPSECSNIPYLWDGVIPSNEALLEVMIRFDIPSYVSILSKDNLL